MSTSSPTEIDPEFARTTKLATLTRAEQRALKKESRRPTWAVALLIGLAVVMTVLIFVFAKEKEVAGGLTVGLMLVLMFMKVPVFLALAVPGVVGMFAIIGSRAAINLLGDVPYSAVASWPLSVLPMFILMGMLLGSSGITTRIYDAARLWFSWLPGGLAVGTNVAGGALAAVSGSTIGITYALGRVGIPEMLKRQYHPRLAIGSTIAAGLPGQLIPPSTFLIIVAGITGAAVGPQLFAGALPGVLMVLMACATIVVISIAIPSFAGRTAEQKAKLPAETITWRARFASLAGVWPVAVLFVAIFGAMFAGILTATEAGALGAFVAVLLTLYFRRKDQPFRALVDGAAQTVVSVGAIFLVLIGAHVLTKLVAVTGIGTFFSDLVIGLGLDRVGFLLVVTVLYLILGMFMDPLAILLFTIPILQPVFGILDIDILWFGVFAVVMGELAILTPPVGILTFIMHTMVQDKSVNLGQKISLKDVFIAVAMFIPGILLMVVLMILFPDFVTWLPSMMLR